MWIEKFPKLKIKKTNSFSRCTLCPSLEKRLEKTKDLKKREIIVKAKRDHNDCQMDERKCYYDKRDRARRIPKKYLSLIIDGMDQSKTNIPHFASCKAKCVNPGDLLQTHVTGIISHGHDEKITFIDLNQYKHDCNLNMNILLQVLKQHACKHLMLPEVLYLQADNCYRESKNKFMLGFCELLVQLNIFREVHLSFLLVGHTHEDIDAMFSKIANTLRRTDAETMTDLITLMPRVNLLHGGLFDIRKWIGDCLVESVK